jgi:hypothetical protein
MMKTTIAAMAERMQAVVGEIAEQAGKAEGFIQRRRKFSGASFVQMLVFGFWSDPAITLEGLVQTAGQIGVEVSAQGVEERFTPAAARVLQRVLEAAVEGVVSHEGSAHELLARFKGGVYVQDSTTLTLPNALAEVWAGCGGGAAGQPSQAALKVQVRWNYSSGGLSELHIQPGRTHDQTTPFAPLPAEALRLADLGYFKLDDLQTMTQQGVYWLTRLKSNCVFYPASGAAGSIGAFLAQQQADQLEVEGYLGQTHRLPCRLVAIRIPPTQADQQRRKKRRNARRKGYTLSEATTHLAGWRLYVTSIPPALASFNDLFILARLRWQIELLFKLWKWQGCLDSSRSQQPWRILCEVFAKLLALLFQHWLTVTALWQFPNPSLVKALPSLRAFGRYLLDVLFDDSLLPLAMASLQRSLVSACRINKSKKNPRAFQLLSAHGGLT